MQEGVLGRGQAVLESLWFQRAITAVIALNAVTLGLEGGKTGAGSGHMTSWAGLIRPMRTGLASSEGPQSGSSRYLRRRSS